MKFVSATVLLVTVLVFVKGETSDDFKAKMGPILEECKDVVFASDEDVDDVLNLKPDLSPTGKCLLACANDKLGFIKCGQFGDYASNKEAYQALFEGDETELAKVEQVVNECIVKAKTEFPYNLCEGAQVAMSCFLKLGSGT